MGLQTRGRRHRVGAGHGAFDVTASLPVVKITAEGENVKQLFVAWTRFQRRPVTMREHFGYDLRFLPAMTINGSVYKAVLSYPMQALKTVRLILREKPDVLWIQSPPNILLHICWIIRLLVYRRLVLIADLHNSAFSRLWFSVPFTRSLLNAFDIVLVHNEEVYRTARDMGIREDVLLVLEDKVPDFGFKDPADGAAETPYFVAPFSFSKDEPLREVLEAAALVPGVQVRVTGDKTRISDDTLISGKPANVQFTGFLPTKDYETLIAGAMGILCLTTSDGIQLSSAIEAVASGKPMIVSDTSLLRNLFSTALFVDNSPSAIAQSLRAIVANAAYYAEQTRTLRSDDERRMRWMDQAGRVTRRVSSQLTPRLGR